MVRNALDGRVELGNTAIDWDLEGDLGSEDKLCVLWAWVQRVGWVEGVVWVEAKGRNQSGCQRSMERRDSTHWRKSR